MSPTAAMDGISFETLDSLISEIETALTKDSPTGETPSRAGDGSISCFGHSDQPIETGVELKRIIDTTSNAATDAWRNLEFLQTVDAASDAGEVCDGPVPLLLGQAETALDGPDVVSLQQVVLHLLVCTTPTEVTLGSGSPLKVTDLQKLAGEALGEYVSARQAITDKRTSCGS